MSDAVQQIKDRLNIVDVVSAYVELSRAGKHMKARCPFHNEKTPSFNVSPERGMYHCYGCGAGGDMFTFIEAIEGVEFKDALKILAAKANVELVPVSPQKKTERDRLYAVLEDATLFYQAELQNASGPRAYLEKRGVLEQTIEKWRIGFVPGPPEASWGVVKEHLVQKGYTESELLKAGLIKLSDKGKDSYDVFRNRIMFPLFDQSGRVVGFSGRTLDTGPDVPKYVNSPETELYKKSELLYGYDKAKQGIRQLDFSLIVEGQFDVVMSHQAGYSNTVAVSGTALTSEHAHLLERFSNRVVLALDSDKAGIAAVKRSADIMLRRGLDVKVALLVGGKDPADIVLKDPKEYKHLIGKSVHVIEFLLEVLLSLNLDERTLKLRAREEVLPYIVLLPNYIDQDHFEGKVAEALKTTKDAIHFEVERLRENKIKNVETVQNPQPVVPEKSSETKNRYQSDLTYLIGVLPLFSESIVTKIKQELGTVTGVSVEELEAEVSQPKRAEVLFRTESFLDKNPRRIFEEEFVHTLTRFRTDVIKSRLKSAAKHREIYKKLQILKQNWLSS
jgi:DNA primase